MDDFELELSLSCVEQDLFSLSGRFNRPDANEEFRPPAPARVTVDPATFVPLALDPEAYGKALQEVLFGDAGMREFFLKARTVARQQGRDLRLRLAINPDARLLHPLRWELLLDPETGTHLLAQEDLLFSRFLSSQDWRAVPLRSKGELRALVVVASPPDLEKWPQRGRVLKSVDVAGELARARESLAGMRVEALAGNGAATLDGITQKLREGFDVLYLACHGALVDGKPRLWLDDGLSAGIAGTDLVERIQDAAQRPRLVALASCESGTGAIADDGGLAALGPRLAQAGVPAVLAMQGSITMKTVALFMPTFFRELARDGRVDRALAAARGRVRDERDWWMPVLFMRLRNGRLWYDGGFAAEAGGFDRWNGLVTDIDQNACVPILGPGITETVLGSFRDIARRWADRYDYPLAPHGREDLGQVAQYLAYDQNASFPRAQLAEYLKRHVIERFGEALPQELREGKLDDLRLDSLVSAAGRIAAEERPDDVHARLARLPFKVYVTACRDNLLYDALCDAPLPGGPGKRKPERVLVRWKKAGDWPRSVFDEEPGFRASEERPVILHLFGNLRWRDTVVLTEDDYFDFLLNVARGLARSQQSQQQGEESGARPGPLIPNSLSATLAASGLLFLGFQIDDWELRILYRALMQEGRDMGEDHTNVAVQINPAEGRILDLAGARKYLERYFQRRRFSIYWGSAEEFLVELGNKRGGQP